MSGSLYWVPSGSYVLTGASTSVYKFSTAGNQIEGVARVLNVDATIAYVGLVTASATVGEATTKIPVSPNDPFFIAYSYPYVAVVVSNASAMINPGYALK